MMSVRLCAARKSVFVICASFWAIAAVADDQIIRFGTGGTTGTYFPVGSLIATEINKRKLSSATDGAVIVLPQRSSGSVANISDLNSNLLEIGLAQADVVRLAFLGRGQFDDKHAKDTLRTIGTLYQESLHLVVRADSDIQTMEDLAGKRVAVDELGSGTNFVAEIVLTACGMTRDDIKPIYLKSVDSMERMRRGALDAIFIVAGYPVSGVAQLVEDGVARLISFSDTAIEQITTEHLYFSTQSILPDTYGNAEDINTLSVSAQMIVRADLAENTVYEITDTLWRQSTLDSLAEGHPRGADISADTALQGIGIPLHDGALRYYRERGYNTDAIPQ